MTSSPLKRPFMRALLAGGALMLVVLIVLVRPWRTAEEPGPKAGFNPAAYAPAPPLDAPYVATDLEVVDGMLALAGVRPNEMVVDLGSGDGRILIAAARSAGARGLGVDIDPARIAEARRNAQAARVANLVTFRQEDLFQTSLGDADVLTLYLTQEVNNRLRPRILAQMRPGTRVVSHDYTMGDWRAEERRRIGTATIYLWTVPARIEGNWTLTLNGSEVPLTISQRYQQFTGAAGVARIEQGRVSGANLRFLARIGGARRTFEGRVEGDAIVPSDPNAGWRAVRAR